MKELPKDIIEEMKSRFKGDFDAALNLLDESLTAVEELNTDQIIRCIIYLSKNGITDLKKNLAAAKNDPRDVMYWAEYEDIHTTMPNRVRDFNNTFKENE